MAKHELERDLQRDVAWVARRWKAVATFVGTTATVLLVLIPGSHLLQTIIGVVGVLTTTGAVHQVQNAGTADVEDTVNAVVNAVPPTVANIVSTAVNETTSGVLAPVTVPITSVNDPGTDSTVYTGTEGG